MSEDQWKYKYQAKVVSGYDGDTITLLVDNINDLLVHAGFAEYRTY